MGTLFKSDQGKKEILELYDKKLESLHLNYQYQTLTTSFGNTNLIVTGDTSKPPILLIHGSNACAPIALETYPGIQQHYCVYAIDVLAQPNKSDTTLLSMKDASYGEWMHEIIDQLKLKDVTLAGFSFGGLIILKTLEYKESNIKEVFLTSPAYIVNGNPLKALFKVFIPMRKYIKTQRVEYVEKFLAEVFTDRDEFAVQYLSKVFLHFKMDFTPVPVISSKNAKGITVPITLFASENDLLFPGKKMIKRAAKIFPSLKSSILLKKVKHVPSSEDNKRIVKSIMNH